MRSMDLKFRSGVPVPKLVFFRAGPVDVRYYFSMAVWGKRRALKNLYY